MVDDLYVNEKCYPSSEQVLEGFNIYFEKIAIESVNDHFDSNYNMLVKMEL